MIDKKTKKQIVIFTDRYPYGKGESFFETELLFLSKNFEKVIVLPIDSGASSKKRPTPENVSVIEPTFLDFKNKSTFIFKGIFNRSPVLPFLIEFVKSKCWKSPKKSWNLFSYTLLTRALLSSYKKNYPEIQNASVLYFYWGLRWSQILPYISKKTNRKTVVRFHGSDLYEHVNNNYIPLREQQLRQIDLAVFISEIGKNYLIDKYPFIKERSYVARLGTNDFGLNPFRENEKIHIVSCSNVVPVKRVHLIAQCLSHISAPITWTHIGGGPLINEITKILQNIPSTIEARLPGAMNHNELMDFYLKNSVTLFINVSSSEGIPVAVMEALSFGIPAIATNVGGTSEIVDENVGSLLDPELTPEILASKIQMVAKRTDYLQLRTSARMRWESMCMADKLYPDFMIKLKDTTL